MSFKRTNKQFLTIVALSVGFNLLFLCACAITDNDQPVVRTPDEVIFPNWKEADRITDGDRYTDTWCEIAHNTEDF